MITRSDNRAQCSRQIGPLAPGVSEPFDRLRANGEERVRATEEGEENFCILSLPVRPEFIEGIFQAKTADQERFDPFDGLRVSANEIKKVMFRTPHQSLPSTQRVVHLRCSAIELQKVRWALMQPLSFKQRTGLALRKRREALNISQEAFAERAEMHRVYYSAIERGAINIGVDMLERLCNALNAPVWEVLKDADAQR